MGTRLCSPTVEHLSAPVGLGVRTPRFSWKIDSDRRDVMQAAFEWELYRVDPVSAQLELLAAPGRVESRQSVLVTPPGGVELKSSTDYEWRVRCWIAGSAEPTDWLAARFATALLDPEHWTAAWIEPRQQAVEPEPELPMEVQLDAQRVAGILGPVAERLHPSPYVRQRFVLADEPVRARLSISAQGLYHAEINGAVVGDEVLAPGYDAHPHRLSFQTYDVTDLLHAGENLLGAILADGWWAGRISFSGIGAEYGTVLRLIWQLEVHYADGGREVFASGPEAVSAQGPYRYADIFVGEKYDARLALHGWSTPGFDDSGWEPVVVPGEETAALAPFHGEPVRRTREFTPSAVLSTPDGATVLDLGQVIAGRVRLVAQGPAGTTITLEHSETLDKEGNFLRNILGLNKDQTDTWVLAGTGGAEEYEPRFTFHGFRYVRVTGYPGDLTQDAATAVVIGSDLAQSGSLSTSDPRINRLHENVVWSQRANFLSIPTDCPQRERAGWTGDVQVFAPSSTNNMGVAAFFTRWLANVRAEQLPDGQVTNIVPINPSFARMQAQSGTQQSSAGWGDVITMLPRTLYERYGDRRFLEENYPAMRAWVEYCRHVAETELVARLDPASIPQDVREHHRRLWNTGFHFGDWLAPSTVGDHTDLESLTAASRLTGEQVASMFHFHSARLLADAARLLGQDKDATEYAGLAEEIAAAFTAEYLDEDGRFATELQGLYVLALAFGITTSDREPQLLAHLERLIADNGDRLDTGFVSVPYLLDVLCSGGRSELAYRILFQERAPSWLYEVDMGATTIWETWDAIAPDGTPSPMSLNHYAFGCVDDWLYRRVGGLNATGPGFATSRIAPDLNSGRFTEVAASIDTPYGLLASSWCTQGAEIELTVAVPPNATAELDLAAAQICAADSGSTAARQTLGSGTYRFTVRL